MEFVFPNDIFRAAAEGKAELLLDLLADPAADHAVTEFGSPLHFAVDNGHLEAIQVLLACGLDINSRRSVCSDHYET